MKRPFLLLALSACAPDDPAEGTFIGNPSLTARVIDNAVQVNQGGSLNAENLLIRGCTGADAILDATSFTFDGALSFDAAAIPEGCYSGIHMPIAQLTLEFDDGADAYSITGHDIDFAIDGSIDAAGTSVHVIALGDEDWLGELAALAEPGHTDANADEPALRDAFVAGLLRSTLETRGATPPGDTDTP